MQDHIIIVAGGIGSRMNNAVPKQFIQLAGKPIVVYTIEKFHRFNPKINIILVLHPEYLDFWAGLGRTFLFNIPHSVITGGEERFHSVRNAVMSIKDETGIVGIHDAVRPFVSMKTLETCYATARAHCNAVPVITMDESLRRVEKDSSEPVDRNVFRIVQTPQCFELSLLRKAYQQEYQSGFTDDASVVESLGEQLRLVHGNRENFKITHPEDLRMAEALLSL
ncbi:MAG: 2-C-methyl-D-erythritol 4-phosphate cytidylyltransferase [Flavobacteriales bacterium]|nr:2-C-methyl-D-erythritol 4-phosphate cytidylyltransferase [Flavobacteriales bacterium]